MTCLDKFLEPIEIAGEAMKEGYKAYKMDGAKNDEDMRVFVGLKTCNCCDYFLPYGNNAIILIEETRLSESLESYRKEYHYLEDSDKDDFALKRMREEVRLKAYGSMLVLCRLKEKCSTARSLFQNKKYHFWLVASGKGTDYQRGVDNLHDNALTMLRGVLSKEIVDTVEVFPPEILRNKLSEHESTP